MGKIIESTVIEAKNYVENILDEKLSKDCVYHSKVHTFDVLRNVETIGKYCGLDEDEMNILRISALFHDVGYISSNDGHEIESVRYAERFLSTRGIDPEIIEQVKNSILATQMPQQPVDLLGQVLCDADMMHLTYKDYFDRIDLLRQEWSNTGKVSLDEMEFHEVALDFFKSHNYFTEYGKNILDPLKNETAFLTKKKLKSMNIA